jgi:hypothetical protein
MIYRSRQTRPYVPFPQAVQQVVQMDDASYAELQREVSGPEAFQITRARTDKLRSGLKMDNEADVVGLLAGLELLHERIHTVDGDDVDAKGNLKGLLKSTSLWPLLSEADERGFNRVAALVVDNPTASRTQKRTWLRTGILANAVGFASFVDIRPNFNKERSEIVELLPIVIFEIETESNYDVDSIVFQMTEETLTQLIAALDDVQIKLKTISTATQFKDLVPAT